MRFISNNDGNTIASKKLQSEIDELTNQLGNTQLDLANETQTRETEDASLSQAIATEQSNRQTADGTLQNNIDALGQDLQDYKDGIANVVNTRTVNTVGVNAYGTVNAAIVDTDEIRFGPDTNDYTKIKAYNNIYVPQGNWYVLATWPKYEIPEFEGHFVITSSDAFKITPDVIETSGGGTSHLGIYISGNNKLLCIKKDNSGGELKLTAKGNHVSVNDTYLSTVVDAAIVTNKYDVDGHVYFNNPADPDTFTVNNTLTTVNANITNADVTNETVDNSEIDVLENSKRNTKKDFITLATHATNTRYYIKIPKFNGSYTCTLIKGTEQLFSFEAVMHGDYCEVNYSSIDINEAQIDTYLEAFYIDGSGNLWFKTFGDGKLYYSYDAEGELAAPESYSNPPANPAITYNCAYHTRKVILSDGSSGIDIMGGNLDIDTSTESISTENLSVNNLATVNNLNVTGSLNADNVLKEYTIPAGNMVSLADVEEIRYEASSIELISSPAAYLTNRTFYKIYNDGDFRFARIMTNFFTAVSYTNGTITPRSFTVKAYKQPDIIGFSNTIMSDQILEAGIYVYDDLHLRGEINFADANISGNYIEGGIERRNINQSYGQYPIIRVSGDGIISFNKGKIKVKFASPRRPGPSTIFDTVVEWIDADLNGIYPSLATVDMYYDTYPGGHASGPEIRFYLNSNNPQSPIFVDYIEGRNLSYYAISAPDFPAIEPGTRVQHGFTGVGEHLYGTALPDSATFTNLTVTGTLNANDISGLGKILKEYEIPAGKMVKYADIQKAYFKDNNDVITGTIFDVNGKILTVTNYNNMNDTLGIIDSTYAAHITGYPSSTAFAKFYVLAYDEPTQYNASLTNPALYNNGTYALDKVKFTSTDRTSFWHGIEVQGNILDTGNLSVMGLADISGDITADSIKGTGNLSVTGNATIGGDITVSGNVKIDKHDYNLDNRTSNALRDISSTPQPAILTGLNCTRKNDGTLIFSGSMYNQAGTVSNLIYEFDASAIGLSSVDGYTFSPTSGYLVELSSSYANYTPYFLEAVSSERGEPVNKFKLYIPGPLSAVHPEFSQIVIPCRNGLS